MWTKDLTNQQLSEVVEFHASRIEDAASQTMASEAQAELDSRNNNLVCTFSGYGHWTVSKSYTIVRETASSFWVMDDKGYKRRFSKKTMEQTGVVKQYACQMA